MRRRSALIAVALAVSFVAAGCGSGSVERLDTVTVSLTHGSSALQIKAEVAATRAQRERGLMGRRSLGSGAGMLFLFPSKILVGFWMKDTLIPLDIAFIADGRVIDVRSMTPCKTERCPLTSPRSPFDGALEVNRGVFGGAGISAGAEVRITGTLPAAS